jgi:hypothetical protein
MLLDPTETTAKSGGSLHLFPKQEELKNNDVRDVASENDFLY